VPTAAHHDPVPEAAASREKAKVVVPPAPTPAPDPKGIVPRPPLPGSTLITAPLCRAPVGSRGARGPRTGRWRSRREETAMVRAASTWSMPAPSAGRLGPRTGVGSVAVVPTETIGNNEHMFDTPSRSTAHQALPDGRLLRGLRYVGGKRGLEGYRRPASPKPRFSRSGSPFERPGDCVSRRGLRPDLRSSSREVSLSSCEVSLSSRAVLRS
jgi:hypothetical protein